MLYPDPSDEYLKALAARALKLYRAAEANANPMQRLVWQSGSFHVFVEAAASFPFDTRPRITTLVNAIMIQVVLKGRELSEAPRVVRRVARRPANTGLD